ncbi:NTF2 domain-containing protein transpeptidase [Actinomadura rudentiformis]|uniref:NTF2 domain-containing protein transpeptidase n=1 Tax=Actinomadura rudentiformis TaxID=359158 RepID=A0A6H9Z4B2_9ACTN|nr:NTF2 domain-containing protein transpeptidase [Actinomadura rudentiformis]
MTSCVVLVGAGTSACFAEQSAMPTVRDFLVAWQVENYDAAAKHTVGAGQDQVARALAGLRNQLDAASMKLALGQPVPAGKEPGKAIVKNGEEAEARFAVKIDLGENGEPWTYTGVMKLKRIKGKWKVVWDPSIIHPRLKAGQRLAVVSQAPRRSPILDATGKSLLRTVPAQVIGVVPGELADPQKTIQEMVKSLRFNGTRTLDTQRLVGRIRSAPPEKFLPLLTVEGPSTNGIGQQLSQVPGLQTKPTTAPIDPAAAPEFVGKLGPATNDRLQQVGAPYQPGDTIGVSGLQLLLQRRLAGTPTVSVIAQDAVGRSVEELRSWPGLRSEPVRTTLRGDVQRRADYALADLPYPASMAVVNPATGAVQAVANHLTNGQNKALEGRYPPGLTFGVVGAEALLNSGMTRDAETDCPASVQVGGRTFTNPGPARGKGRFDTNFIMSCVTTLAALSSRLDASALTAAAGRFGLGKDWGMSVPAFTGTMPVPRNDAEKAAMMIGEGGVEVSPLAMALAAGGVANGTWRPAFMLTNPRDAQTGITGYPLAATAVLELKYLLRRSVFRGTAKDANVGPNPVSGMTATVTTNGKTVSWFVGFRAEFAFAIAVEGKFNAAALVKRFLAPNDQIPRSSG